MYTVFGPVPYLTEKGAVRPRVAELRLKSDDGSFHIAPPSPVLLGSKHQGSGYRAISKFPRPCQRGAGESRAVGEKSPVNPAQGQ